MRAHCSPSGDPNGTCSAGLGNFLLSEDADVDDTSPVDTCRLDADDGGDVGNLLEVKRTNFLLIDKGEVVFALVMSLNLSSPAMMLSPAGGLCWLLSIDVLPPDAFLKMLPLPVRLGGTATIGVDNGVVVDELLS